MLPEKTRNHILEQISSIDHPRELVVDVLYALQAHYGWLSDEAVAEAAELLGMSPLEVEELATFYTFTFREPVGKYVIHLCDSLICWMDGCEPLRVYLSRKLGIAMGETTSDGLFTLLPVCCIGYCDRSPAMLINRRVYGNLTPEKIDEIIENLMAESQSADDRPNRIGSTDK